jgi:sec-independent protein translocase protein TatB
MDFLGIGPLELLFIMLIAILVFGPKDISKAGRSAGRFLNQLYRSEFWKLFTETSRTIRTLPNRLAREAALEDLDTVRQSIRETGEEVTRETQQVDETLRAWTTAHTPPPEPPVDPLPSASEDEAHEA